MSVVNNAQHFQQQPHISLGPGSPGKYKVSDPWKCQGYIGQILEITYEYLLNIYTIRITYWGFIDNKINVFCNEVSLSRSN